MLSIRTISIYRDKLQRVAEQLPCSRGNPKPKAKLCHIIFQKGSTSWSNLTIVFNMLCEDKCADKLAGMLCNQSKTVYGAKVWLMAIARQPST